MDRLFAGAALALFSIFSVIVTERRFAHYISYGHRNVVLNRRRVELWATMGDTLGIAGMAFSIFCMAGMPAMFEASLVVVAVQLVVQIIGPRRR